VDFTPERDEMTSFRKIAASVTCVAVICGAAILWSVYKDKAAGRKLVEAAKVRAEQGEASAQYSLGSRYRKGEGVPLDYAESVRWFRKAAEQGDAPAQYALGYMYYEGKGVSRDDAESVRWSRKAADQGVPSAQYVLGFMYDWGKGVSRDDAEAVRWYRKAADQGDAQAQYALAGMYRLGQGVPRDVAEAVRWYRKAAGQGDKMAPAALAIIYFKGQGVPKDYLEVVYWLGKVAASCFVVTNGGPLERWLFILVVVFALPMLVVPKRRWGRATWMPWALGSAASAAMLAHELLLPESSLALFARGPLGMPWRGTGQVVWLAFLAVFSVYCAIGVVVHVRQGSDRSA
jgi:Sel1 repeat